MDSLLIAVIIIGIVFYMSSSGKKKDSKDGKGDKGGKGEKKEGDKK